MKHLFSGYVLILSFLCAFLATPAWAIAPCDSIPMSSRLPLSLAFVDVTGSGIDTVFRNAFDSLRTDAYIYTLSSPRAHTMFEHWVLTLGANPFRSPEVGDSMIVEVRCEIERADYGPFLDISGDMGNSSVLGPIGLMLTRHHDDAFTVTVQCRVTLEHNSSVPPLLIRTSELGDVTRVSRAYQVNVAVRKATELILVRLAESLADAGTIPSLAKRYELSKKKAFERVGEYLHRIPDVGQ